MVSTTNILTIRPPRSPESQPQSGHPSETLGGSLSVVSALDLIEWLCSNRKIWSLRLHGQGQGQTHEKAITGEVVVVEGQLVAARWGNIHGLPALCEIVGCQQGTFDLAPVSGSVERTLDGHWQSLLLSAVQMLDERNHQNRDGSQPEEPRDNQQSSSSTSSGQLMLIALPPEGQAQSAAANASAVTLIDQGFAALRAGNPADARQCWTQALALDPDNRSLQFNLRKLDSSS